MIKHSKYETALRYNEVWKWKKRSPGMKPCPFHLPSFPSSSSLFSPSFPLCPFPVLESLSDPAREYGEHCELSSGSRYSPVDKQPLVHSELEITLPVTTANLNTLRSVLVLSHSGTVFLRKEVAVRFPLSSPARQCPCGISYHFQPWLQGSNLLSTLSTANNYGRTCLLLSSCVGRPCTYQCSLDYTDYQDLTNTDYKINLYKPTTLNKLKHCSTTLHFFLKRHNADQ